MNSRVVRGLFSTKEYKYRTLGLGEKKLSFLFATSEIALMPFFVNKDVYLQTNVILHFKDVLRDINFYSGL